MAASALAAAWVEPYDASFDAEYVGSGTCGSCHTGIHARWSRSSHARMTRTPTPESVVGDFDDGRWHLPASARRGPVDDAPAARTFRRDGRYFMALRHPHDGRFVPFELAFVIGFQYRQVYLTQETGGVLRRLPLQWSVPRGEFFPYWNLQEGSEPTLVDLWSQMGARNSAWNLFCARCHTTNLQILAKDARHTRAKVDWLEPGIACEACHGPGSRHAGYFRTSYVNRVAAYFTAQVQGERAPYIASAEKLAKGPALSVCARCHGTDILMGTTDVYRTYEPGFSRAGKTNDLSPYFFQAPLTPGRTDPTVEVYLDGRPKGIGMVFRSFVESACYEAAEVRCADCHDPHDNRGPRAPGMLEPSTESDAYCLGCHEGAYAAPSHTHHAPGTPGARCLDCHMPKTIEKITAGVRERTRTHRMSSIPDPAATVRYGRAGAPNACGDCHADRTPGWALEAMRRWSSSAPGGDPAGGDD